MSISREQFEDLTENHGLEVVAFDVLVQGTEHRRSDVEDYIRGVLECTNSHPEGEYSVSLEYDPNNEYDSFAIKVFGEWKSAKSSGKRHIGFVPKKLAYKIGMNYDDDEPLFALVSSINGSKADGFDILFHIAAHQ